MNEEKSNEESKTDVAWICWFQGAKKTHPFSLAIFLAMLGSFVKQHPSDARYLTIQDLHAILLDEI